MRRLLITCLAALTSVAAAATPTTVTLEVRNMNCPVCPITVKKSLERVPGVHAVEVNLDRKTATVTYDPDLANPEALAQATTAAGYPARVAEETQ